MKKNLIVKQEYSKECGSACLLSIIRYYGGNISIDKLVELTKTDKFGTNFYNISLASKELGLDSKCYKIDTINNLFEINKPFITQIIINNYTHFVVVYKVTKTKVVLMDPGQGKVIESINSFLNKWTGYIMLFSPNKKLPIINSNNYLKEIIIKVLYNNKRIIINILSLSILFALTTSILSFYLKVLIDNVINTDISNLILITIIFSILTIIKYLSDYSRYELLLYLNQKLDLSIIVNTFNKILLLPYSYFKNKTTGDIISRINDLVSIKNLLSKIIITVFLDIIITIVSGFILYNISPKLFLFLVAIISLYIIIYLIFKGIIIKYTNINQENNAKVNSFLVENINGYETIKGLNIENIIKRKFSKLYSNLLEINLSYERVINKEILLNNIISNIGQIIVIFYGIIEINKNNISIGIFITFYYLSSYFLEPIKSIIDLNKDYYYAKNAFKRVNNLLEIKSINHNTNNLEIKGNIDIKNLNFSYNEYSKVLNNINISIKEKDKVLILGTSGSGKSTLLKIIYKYYNIPRNKILINNYDINDYQLGDIRNKTSYISQNEILYTDTIKNNILLERDIDYEEFLKICKITYVDEIVKNKFLGYDEILEENGSNLSGGEKQRIILARTLLKNNNLLLIDEGFSEIDINTERKILKNIFKIYNNLTIIIVSHRIENIDLYDKVIKINNGSITNLLSREMEINYG